MLVTEQSEEDLGNLAGLGTLWAQSHDQKKPGNGNEIDLAIQCANRSSLALKKSKAPNAICQFSNQPKLETMDFVHIMP